MTTTANLSATPSQPRHTPRLTELPAHQVYKGRPATKIVDRDHTAECFDYWPISGDYISDSDRSTRERGNTYMSASWNGACHMRHRRHVAIHRASVIYRCAIMLQEIWELTIIIPAPKREKYRMAFSQPQRAYVRAMRMTNSRFRWSSTVERMSGTHILSTVCQR